MGKPLRPSANGAAAAKAAVRSWAASGSGSGPALAESGARPRLAEGLLLRLARRSEPDLVRDDDGGVRALRALLCL